MVYPDILYNPNPIQSQLSSSWHCIRPYLWNLVYSAISLELAELIQVFNSNRYEITTTTTDDKAWEEAERQVREAALGIDPGKSTTVSVKTAKKKRKAEAVVDGQNADKENGAGDGDGEAQQRKKGKKDKYGEKGEHKKKNKDKSERKQKHA
jgi:hypothetical protein